MRALDAFLSINHLRFWFSFSLTGEVEKRSVLVIGNVLGLLFGVAGGGTDAPRWRVHVFSFSPPPSAPTPPSPFFHLVSEPMG